MKASTRRVLALGATVTIAGLSLGPSSVDASVTGDLWKNTADHISSGNQSNVTGFWQTLMCSNSRGGYIDGIFGSQTVSNSQGFTNDMIGTATSNITSSVWGQVQTALAPPLGPGFPPTLRLEYVGGNFWSYYGGGPTNAALSHAPFTSQIWKFKHPGNGQWYNATSAKNMPSINVNCGF